MTRIELLQRIADGDSFTYHPFLKGILSQWRGQPFRVDGTTYKTCEHYMMAEKARCFGDDKTHAAIMAAETPRAAKDLGRVVTPYDNDRWAAVRRSVVVRGNLAKFSQDVDAWQALRETGDAVLVEVNPRDSIWGIGLADGPDAHQPYRWQGENLLGFALMEVRAELRRVLG